MPTTTVTANTNLVLVNTASINSNIVELPGNLTIGQVITIRDNQGAASSNKPITIRTTSGVLFDTGITLPDGQDTIKINQPFGAVTVAYAGLKNMGGANPQPTWNILNTFAFDNPKFGSVDAMTVSSITLHDTLTGINSLLSVNNNQLVRDGSLVAPPPTNWASYGAINHVNMSNYNINNVSNINVSNILTVNTVNVTGSVDLNNNTITNLSNLDMVGVLRINGEEVIPGGGGGGGGGTPSNWASYPATHNVNMSNFNISNILNINALSYSLNGEPFTGAGGTPSNWASYPATHNVNMSNFNISNILNINALSYSLNGEPFTGAGGTPSNWASYPATQGLNMSNNSITNVSNIGVGTLGVPSESILVVADGTTLTTFVNELAQGQGFTTTPDIIYDIYNNGSLWVAGGDTGGYTYTSSDGSNWTKNNTSQTLEDTVINNIIYADNKWIAVGGVGASLLNAISYSVNGGINWFGTSHVFSAPLNCIAYNGSKYIIGGDIGNGWTLAGISDLGSDSVTPILTGGFTDAANRILYANNKWVAVGHDTNGEQIQYSTNRVDWNVVTNVTNPGAAFFPVTDQGNALAYGNGYWLAGGYNYIYGSPDGINFSLLYDFQSTNEVYDIKYNGGSTFYATYRRVTTDGTLAKSTDNGSNWETIGVFTSEINRMGILYTPGVTSTDSTLIGGGTVDTTTINASNINASNINVTGSLNTDTINSKTGSAITINNNITAQEISATAYNLNTIPITGSSSSNLLLYNSVPVNPVGAYIELQYSNGYVTYPLYVTSTANHITVDGSDAINGQDSWWRPYNSNTTIFSGITLLPYYTLNYGITNALGSGPFSADINTNFPIYISVADPATNSLYYTLTPI